MDEKKIFCVIPAYNEAENIIGVIAKVKPFVNAIIVVDDCSQDETYALIKNQGVIALRHIINRGQGAALQTGNEYALEKGADIIVHFDADGQFQAEEIPELIHPLLTQEAEAVFGSRFLTKKSNLPWKKEKIIMPLARLINKIFFNIKLTDPQSGFRAFLGSVARNITIENDGAAHCSEILSKVVRQEFKIKEVPITVTYHHSGQGLFGGKGRGMGGFKIIKDLIITKLIN